MRILGIDPGSRKTGFGVVELINRKFTYISSGCIRLEDDDLQFRLSDIFSGINEVITKYKPNIAAIEQVFVHKNANSALKLGQARGVAIVACSLKGINVSEYSPRSIKQSVVGYGAASKDQVQHMVKTLLSLNKAPQSDAADALAIALCHGQSIEVIR